MDILELKSRFPKLYQEVFALGFNSEVKCQFNSEANRDDSEQRKVEAAELIAGSVQGRDRAPVSYARVPAKVAGSGGPAFVVPTY